MLLIAAHLCYLIKYLVVFMTVVHTYFYIVVDTQRGFHTLKSLLHVVDTVRGETALEVGSVAATKLSVIVHKGF